MKQVIVAAILLLAQSSYAQQVIPLYNKVPNSKKAPAGYVEEMDSTGLISNVTDPTLTLYLPEKPTGTAVIICPGGGYFILGSVYKSADIAKEFTNIGITVFVLKYRLPNDAIMIDKTIGPLQDGQMALLTVRKRAAEWGIDPHKVGFVGLSAGGHLVSTVGTHLNSTVIENKENISLRPDFMMLIYPVLIFDKKIPSRVRENLVGKMASDELISRYSNEKHVTSKTPATFLVHAADDDVVPVKNCLLFFDALQRKKVNAEMHIFQSGGHGFGLDKPWFNLGKEWLKENGF